MGQNSQCCNSHRQFGDLGRQHPVFKIKDPKDSQTSPTLASSNKNNNNESMKVKNLQAFQDDYYHLQKCPQPPLLQIVKQVRSSLGPLPYNKLQSNQGKLDDSFYLLKRSGKIYHGEWNSQRKPHGSGEMYFPNGSFYEGEYVDGIPYGYGRLIMAKGQYYEGQIKYGRANGFGTFAKEQCEYKGGFLDDQKHGAGEQKSLTYYFKGTFEFGQKSSGILKYNDSCLYEGEFQEDVFHGQGTLQSNDGVYRGNFKNGQQCGYGQFRWKDGSVYRGNYYNGERQGDGQFYNIENSSIAKGFWSKGVINGQGQYQQATGHNHRVIWKQGRIQTILKTNV